MMMHFQQFLWHFLNVFFAATFSKQMIRNIIGDVICLQRLQIIGEDRLEAEKGGDFTNVSGGLFYIFKKVQRKEMFV